MHMNQKGFSNIIIAIIIGAVIILGGAHLIVKRSGQSVAPEPKLTDQQPGAQQFPAGQSPQQSVTPISTPSANVSANVKSLFGTMLAFNISDAPMDTPGILYTLQKGWTELKKDNSAYQNLKSNLKKLIQDRTKLVKATGFSIDRGFNYFTWNVIEPQKGQFDWELTDLYAQAASNAGVKISAVIQPFASWDQKNTLPLANCNALDFAFYDYKAGPPNDLAEYENFLTKTVERYKDKVAVWEIGNEIEGDCGGYQNNPEGYLKLLKISYDVIKEADPGAKVLNGGALEFPDNSIRNFWTKFFQLGGGQYIDYFNIHYNIERSPSPKLDPAIFQEKLTFFNNLMEKNGGKKPLYLTEFGIYSGSPSFPQPLGQPTQGPGQVQTNVPTQPPSSGQSSNQPCGDGVCDAFEKQNPNACPKDCGGSTSSGNQEQPFGQPTQGQTTGQNIQPNQGQTLRNVSENEQAALYFKDSILAFANGVKVVFIDLIGIDNGVIGSSMAFNPEGKPRLFLTALKTITNKIGGFSDVKKISDGQYKFTVDSKTVYALWSGPLSSEISGKVKMTDMKGREQLMDVTGIKLKADQPVFIEL